MSDNNQTTPPLQISPMPPPKPERAITVSDQCQRNRNEQPFFSSFMYMSPSPKPKDSMSSTLSITPKALTVACYFPPTPPKSSNSSFIHSQNQVDLPSKQQPLPTMRIMRRFDEASSTAELNRYSMIPEQQSDDDCDYHIYGASNSLSSRQELISNSSNDSSLLTVVMIGQETVESEEDSDNKKSPIYSLTSRDWSLDAMQQANASRSQVSYYNREHGMYGPKKQLKTKNQKKTRELRKSKAKPISLHENQVKSNRLDHAYFNQHLTEQEATFEQLIINSNSNNNNDETLQLDLRALFDEEEHISVEIKATQDKTAIVEAIELLITSVEVAESIVKLFEATQSEQIDESSKKEESESERIYSIPRNIPIPRKRLQKESNQSKQSSPAETPIPRERLSICNKVSDDGDEDNTMTTTVQSFGKLRFPPYSPLFEKYTKNRHPRCKIVDEVDGTPIVEEARKKEHIYSEVPESFIQDDEQQDQITQNSRELARQIIATPATAYAAPLLHPKESLLANQRTSDDVMSLELSSLYKNEEEVLAPRNKKPSFRKRIGKILRSLVCCSGKSQSTKKSSTPPASNVYNTKPTQKTSRKPNVPLSYTIA